MEKIFVLVAALLLVFLARGSARKGRPSHRACHPIRAQVVGIAHLGLGCDFDGSVTVPFDAAHVSELTGALLQEGFSGAEIRAVMGGNALRFFREDLPHE